MNNIELHERNCRVIPGGTASAARHLGLPLVFKAAQGARLVDADGKTYIDINGAFGAILLGHRDQRFLRRVEELTSHTDLVGLGSTPLEGDLAQRLIDLIPCAEMVSFCSSGTEATFHAIRLARAITQRRYIVKFQGAYHGWHDYVAMNFMSARSGLGRSDPFTAGALPEAIASTLVLPFNNSAAFADLMQQRGHEIAGVIVEPIMHNVGAIVGTQEFLHNLRTLTHRHGSLLIFDEIITGIRQALGGYQSICGVEPDLATFGKALGNGFPIALVTGRRELMQRFAPPSVGGDVSLGGTYNALPMAVAAGLVVLERMSVPGTHARLTELGDLLKDGLNRLAASRGSRMIATSYGSVVCVHFVDVEAGRYEDLVDNDRELDIAFRKALLHRGVACSSSPLRRFHLTLAHTRSDIEAVLAIAAAALDDAIEQSTPEKT